MAVREVGALMRRHSSGIQALRPARQRRSSHRGTGMSGIHIAVRIVGTGLRIDAGRILITGGSRSRSSVPRRLWLPLGLRLRVPLVLRLLPLGLRVPLTRVILLVIPLTLRLGIPLRLRGAPLGTGIVQALVITDGEAGAVLGIDTSRILGSLLVLGLGQGQGQEGGEELGI